MANVHFEINEKNLETGMRGYPVGFCTTSTVDPVKGLFYMGKPVHELSNLEPEQVIYLLFNSIEGSTSAISQFKKELALRAQCSGRLLEQIRRLPREGHPMKLFSTALLLCGMLEGQDDYREDALNLVAKIPQLVAEVINHHAGWDPSNPSQPDLGYIENFVQMLRFPGKKSEELTASLKLFNILHYDHGGGNLSTFVGKAIASGLEDLYGSLCGAMCALEGSRHGRANQDCIDFVQSLVDELGADASDREIEKSIRNRLFKKELIFGFGHAVLRVEDPRATLFYQIAETHYSGHPLVKIALRLRKVVPQILQENSKITNPYPNVDAISGILLMAAGFPYPIYLTVLFGLARCIGISRQIVYERLEARDGKGTPIIRPKYFYKGPESDKDPHL